MKNLIRGLSILLLLILGIHCGVSYDSEYEKHGYIFVKLEGKHGVLNKEREVLIPCEFDSVMYDEDRFIVLKADSMGLYSKDGNLIVPSNNWTIEITGSADNPPLAKVHNSKTGLTYYFDQQGNAYYAMAQSTLEKEDKSFSLQNLFDNKISTSWCEDVQKSDEKGTIHIEFPAKTTVSGLSVVNGFAFDDEKYNEYSRAKTLLLEFSDGSNELLSLEDTHEKQSFNFSPRKTNSMKIILRDAYTGKRQKNIALTEVDILTDSLQNKQEAQKLIADQFAKQVQTIETGVHKFFDAYSKSSLDNSYQAHMALYTDPTYFLSNWFSKDKLTRISENHFNNNVTLEHSFDVENYELLDDGNIEAVVKETSKVQKSNSTKTTDLVVRKRFTLQEIDDAYKVQKQSMIDQISSVVTGDCDDIEMYEKVVIEFLEHMKLGKENNLKYNSQWQSKLDRLSNKAAGLIEKIESKGRLGFPEECWDNFQLIKRFALEESIKYL